MKSTMLLKFLLSTLLDGLCEEWLEFTNMQTCDVIEAMQAIEKKMGYPICVDSVQFSPFGNFVYVYFVDASYYTWDIGSKRLDYFTGK